MGNLTVDIGREPVFRPEDEALRHDVGLLGALLGEVLREQAGEDFFHLVETVRHAAIRRRADDADAELSLEEQLTALDAHDAVQLVRAFSSYFSLVNLAEQVHRIRRRREYLRDPEGVQPGSLRAVVRRLKDAGLDRDQLTRLITEARVEPVFTAHPTEATRRTILAKEQRICRLLVDRIQQPQMTPAEVRGWRGRLREEITQAWQTDEQPTIRPTVADEVEHTVFFLSEVIYRVVPAFYQELSDAVAECFGDELGCDLATAVFRFATWVGGDMDGNPNVGAATIEATLARQRELVLNRYRGELRRLFDHLSQSLSRVAVDRRITQRIEAYRRLLPEAAHAISDRYREMPYRHFLWLIWERVGMTLADAKSGYSGPDELVADLELIASSLDAHRGRHGGLFAVSRLIRRVQTFGFHLATLDTRQDAELHRQAVAQLLGDPEFPSRSAVERARALRSVLQEGLAVVSPEDHPDPGRRVLEAFAAAGRVRRRFGAEAMGPMIISMARGPDDVLAVLALALAAGAVDDDGAVPFDVAPLFETVDDLEASARSLSDMLGDPVYRAHLRRRGDHQLIMLGYSDSSKISGIAASRWALFRAQEELVAVAGSAGVHLSFFHGRGGTAGRGGSKPRSAILADPCGAVRGRVRVTEQGEIINTKYGLRGIAERSLELMAGAVFEATALCEQSAALPAAWRSAMDTIADSGRAAYDALVHHDPAFVPYFRAATPIDVIERMPIGSRPASRRHGGGVANLRAIPWVFSWMQSRQVLPGWYGIGSGLATARHRHGLEVLLEMAAAWPFFANLLADVEMVLAKADLKIAGRYAALAGADGKPVFERITAEYQRTRDLVLEVAGHGELLAAEPVLQQSIRLRNPYVDPMSLVQVDLLERWRRGDRRDGDLERALFATVRGIARGLRNTG